MLLIIAAKPPQSPGYSNAGKIFKEPYAVAYP